jgi:hypothetical protein
VIREKKRQIHATSTVTNHRPFKAGMEILVDLTTHRQHQSLADEQLLLLAHQTICIGLPESAPTTNMRHWGGIYSSESPHTLISGT